MKIVKNLDLDKYPNLPKAGLTRLGKLTKIPSKKQLEKILNNYDPSMDSESERPKSVLKFKKSLDELIKSQKVSKKGKKSDRFKEVDKICRDIQKINEQIQNIHTNNKVRNYVAYNHGVNSYFDARDIFDKMEDWFKHFFKEIKPEVDLEDTLL